MRLSDKVKKIIENYDATTDSELVLSGFLHDKHIPVLVSALNEHPEIKQVNLYYNNLTGEGAEILSGLKHVNTLILERNNIEGEGIKALVQSNIKELNLNDNGLTDEDAKIISKYAKQTELEVFKNPKISEALLKEIDERIQSNKTKSTQWNKAFISNANVANKPEPPLVETAETKTPKKIK